MVFDELTLFAKCFAKIATLKFRILLHFIRSVHVSGHYKGNVYYYYFYYYFIIFHSLTTYLMSFICKQ